MLEGLSVFGHHGARPYEKEAGQRLEVDLELDPTDDRAETSDRLADAVDYILTGWLAVLQVAARYREQFLLGMDRNSLRV